MTPSVIPARLEFQCGHAALVSLPKIKGETSAQRAARIAAEKQAALARQCDFCAPVVDVTQPVMSLTEPVAVESLTTSLVTDALHTAADGAEVAHGQNGTSALDHAAPEVAEPEPAPLAATDGETDTAPRIRRRRMTAVRQRRIPPADAREFLIEYRVQRVVRAVDVRDALRQVESLGATDVLEIARQD